ncbi:MAG TPA: hypothetical protein DEF06_01205 [Clostridiales bacterium]|nr:hypothetical protein [Clostridiales bacterium]
MSDGFFAKEGLPALWPGASSLQRGFNKNVQNISTHAFHMGRGRKLQNTVSFYRLSIVHFSHIFNTVFFYFKNYFSSDQIRPEPK